MRCAFTLVAALAIAIGPQSSGRAAPGRPMAIDDLITAIRVSDPQLSPDGTRVLFVRTTTDGNTGKRNADIWSAAAEGPAAPRELIGGASADNTPRYSPDGRRIAFISSRDGAPQV